MQRLRSTSLFLWSTLDRLLLVALVFLAVRVSPAAEPSSVDSATAAANQLKARNDPTIIEPSVWLDTEWDHYQHGAEEVTWTLAGLWVRRVNEWQDWALRLKVPIVYNRSDEASGHAEIGGLGDIEVATGTAIRLNKTWRTGGGIELHADTESNPALGDSVWRLHSLWSVAHDVTNWLTLAPTAEYSHSIAEENNVAPQRYLELSLPVTFVLPQHWSINMRYKAKVDFENGDHWTHTGDIGIAKRLPRIPLVFSAGLEKDFNGGNKVFQASFTMTYYFERYHASK